MSTLNAVEMNLKIAASFNARGYPEEMPQAFAHFGNSLERLAKWVETNDAENSRIRDRLLVTPLPQSMKDEIIAAKRAAIEGDADPSTPLDLSRRLSLPLAVVLYVADGEPRTDTRRRPWLRR